VDAVTVDSMLGWLARWLRMLGVGARYNPALDDEELRVMEGLVITRDRGLCSSRRKPCLLLRSSNHLHWLCTVATVLDLELRLTERSLCPHCGSGLIDADHDARAPPGVRGLRLCVGCGRVYWEGSHHVRINGTLRRATVMLGGVRAVCTGSELSIILEDYGDELE
jgi:hypothetical protein